MTSIRVDDAEVTRGLVELQSRLVRLRPVLDAIGQQLLFSTRERFRSQTAPDGTPWRPLSRAYAASKARQGKLKKLLQFDGRLIGSLTFQSSDDAVRIGTNVPYARIHQAGGSFAVAPRSGSVKLRTGARGTLLRRGNLATFASARHEPFVVRDYLRAGFLVNIPARPFLGLSPDDRSSIRAIVTRYLSGP